ncbi:NnrS family protein [Paracoccus albus]|uniref:NnrS family protein n=1 Tax=Paracoccus albus TaxID=3017784 RepID=UPI0022F03E4B|nr:NnrS family protein [Paracoccus albus]WBU58939.1 NnrS family protein [Paracoccus albus]
MQQPKRPRTPRGLKQDGAALWSYGFRPFFLGGAVWAIVSMALWIAALAHGVAIGGDYGGSLWHAHEMTFGFAPAVLAGFLLTAIPNWTGRLPVSGGPLIALFALWLIGRIGMLLAGLIGIGLAALLDAAFLPVLIWLCAREIIGGRKWQNLMVLAGVAVVTAGNLGFHLAMLTAGNARTWLHFAVAGYVVLVTIIGGRIIPSFTRNWLSQRGSQALPVPFGRFDLGTIAVSAIALLFWVALPFSPVTAALSSAAAMLNAVRLARWRGWLVGQEWLLLVLHLSYCFVPLGLLAIAATALGAVSETSSLHLLTVGVIATMMLAVMSRATRGHTGRSLSASRMTIAAYLCLFAAALLRPVADLSGMIAMMEAAGILWIAAFGLFVVENAPMLLHVRRPARAAEA